MAVESRADWLRRMVAEQEWLKRAAAAKGDTQAQAQAEREADNYRRELERLGRPD